MSDSNPLPPFAREAFEAELRRLAEQSDHVTAGDGASMDYGPALWVFSQLIDEAGGRPTESAAACESAVRSRFSDGLFSDQGGDAVIDPRHQLRMDTQVRLVVNALRRLPAQGHAGGDMPRKGPIQW